MSVREPADAPQAAFRPGHDEERDEKGELVEAEARGPDSLQRMDPRRHAAPAGLPPPARGQGSSGRGPRSQRFGLSGRLVSPRRRGAHGDRMKPSCNTIINTFSRG